MSSNVRSSEIASWFTRVGLLVVLAVGVIGTSTARAATVTIDAAAYGAGEVAIIGGSGWQPGEIVAFDITQDPALLPGDTLYGMAEYATAEYATADEAGNIHSGYVVPGFGVEQVFTLTAMGLDSQYTTQATFANSMDSAMITLSPIATLPVTTNKQYYAPGERVLISGSGWEPGETVAVELVEDPQIHPAETLHTIADDGGRIFAGYIVDDHDLGRTFSLTVMGLSSNLTAQTTFTDDPPPVVHPGLAVRRHESLHRRQVSKRKLPP